VRFGELLGPGAVEGIEKMAIGIILADDDIKSRKMIDWCKSCTWKSGTRTWIRTPDALRVARNRKWKTAAETPWGTT
jgi:hypothetical protein